jgi:hypothetical protein
MRKHILTKAIKMADISKTNPGAVVITKPGQFAKKPAAQVLSERLYTRLTPGEMRRLKDCVGTVNPLSEFLRTLVLDYLDKQPHEQTRKKSK